MQRQEYIRQQQRITELQYVFCGDHCDQFREIVVGISSRGEAAGRVSVATRSADDVELRHEHDGDLLAWMAQ
jgi:hypothetical protein